MFCFCPAQIILCCVLVSKLAPSLATDVASAEHCLGRYVELWRAVDSGLAAGIAVATAAAAPALFCFLPGVTQFGGNGEAGGYPGLGMLLPQLLLCFGAPTIFALAASRSLSTSDSYSHFFSGHFQWRWPRSHQRELGVCVQFTQTWRKH
jgi:hypothetical protein